jgi:hypothetical protein
LLKIPAYRPFWLKLVLLIGLFANLLSGIFLPANYALAAAPVAGDDSYNATEDTTLNVPAPGLLQNDSDPENDPVSFFISSAPTNGSISIDPSNNGAFTFTPGSNFNGVATFTYRLFDGTAFSNLATVTLTVAAVNDAPVANNDTYSAATGQPLNIAAPGVLANDTDIENNPLTIIIFTPAANGTINLNPDGSFTYTSNAGFSGTDTFTYQASDGNLPSNTATVSINVINNNQPPTVANDNYVINQDTPLTVAAPGILQNDSDPENNPITAQLVTAPANGTLNLNPDGSFSYQPNTGFSGADSFTYRASDGLATSVNNATVSITVVPVSMAIISVANARVTEGNTGTGTVSLVFNVTLNKTSAQSVSLSYATTDGSATAPTDYTATSGTLTFAPGETAKTIAVSVRGDTLVEADETMRLNLSNPVNGVLANTSATGTIIDDDGEKEVRPADLLVQLRVNPDREFGIGGGASNFVFYQVVVKNIGPGKANRTYLKLPIAADLEIAYATFSNPKTWVEKIGQEDGDGGEYVQVRLPDFEPEQTVTSTLVFRARSTAAVGVVTSRIKVFWNDEVAPGRNNASNAVRYLLVAGSANRNDTGGEVQFLDVISAESNSKKLVVAGDFFAPEELVDFWYTDKNGVSKKLVGAVARASRDGYIRLEINLDKVTFAAGQTYIIAGYGARSGVYGSLIVEVSSAANPQIRQPVIADYKLFVGIGKNR